MLKIKNILALVLFISLTLGICTVRADEQGSDESYAQQYLNKLQIGMTVEEVIEAIGEPISDIGSGRYLPTYIFADASSFTLEFDNENLLSGVIGDTYTLSKRYSNKTALAKAVLGSDGLKIIEGVDETAPGITRAKMVEVMFNVFGYKDRFTNTENFTIYDYYNIIYDDVDNTHWACAYIYGAQPALRLCGDGVSKFRPDDFCTYGEFYKSILHTIGWGKYYEVLKDKSSYPYVYYNLAENIGLNFKDCFDETMSVDDFYLYVYESLMFNHLTFYGFGAQSMHINDSVLYATYYIDCITGQAEIAEDNTVKIGDIEFYGTDDSLDGLKEGYVVCFYENDYETGENIIHFIGNVSAELSDEIKTNSEEVKQRKENDTLLSELYEYTSGYYHSYTPRRPGQV